MKRFLAAALCTLALAAAVLALLRWEDASLPGLTGRERTLLRIWMVNAPGGGQAWLRQQLASFEKSHPGVSTYLRSVAPQELTAPDALLPDIVLYMPATLTDPQMLFLPLSGDMVTGGGLREPLLRCGRWQGQQYALPLCWGAWVLAIDAALEQASAVTPAPTTLLGRPAATAPAHTEAPYPLDAAVQADCPLQSPGGAALFTLGLLLTERPPQTDDFAALSSGEVYEAFRRRQCATAVLTTGQEAALTSLVSSGNSFPFRTMAAEEIITDQVWLASITADAPPEAALLLSCLVSAEAQQLLYTQSLHTVREDLTLYTVGTPAAVEHAARCSLTAVNAYLQPQSIAEASWQFYQGTLPLSDALTPLV